MKKLLTFMICAGLSISLFAADIFTYAPINGSIKSYTETQYSIASKFGNYFRTPSTKITHEYNEKGLQIASTEFTSRDAVVDKITSKYDANDRLIENVCTTADGEEIWKQVTTYKDGIKVDISEYNAKGVLKDKEIFTYEGNKLVDSTNYDEDGALVWKTTYKYNDSGKVEIISQYSSDGALSEQAIYTYTDSGKIDSITTFVTFTGKQTQEVFRYATNGTLNEITTYDAVKQVIKRVLLKYDSNDNVNKISEYDVAEKFGTTVNELVAMSEFVYQY